MTATQIYFIGALCTGPMQVAAAPALQQGGLTVCLVGVHLFKTCQLVRLLMTNPLLVLPLFAYCWCGVTKPLLLLPLFAYCLCDVCSLPAGAVAKVLQAALAAETMPIDAGLEFERCVWEHVLRSQTAACGGGSSAHSRGTCKQRLCMPSSAALLFVSASSGQRARACAVASGVHSTLERQTHATECLHVTGAQT